MNGALRSDNKMDQTLPFLMDHVPDAFLLKAERELNETAERRTEGLIEMKERMKSNKTLKNVAFQDDVLRMFLRHGKYDIDKTIQRLDMYTRFRKSRLIFDGISEKKCAQIKARNIFTFLPKRDHNGCIIFILKYENWNPEEIAWPDFIGYAMTILNQCLRDPVTQISGMVSIHDFKNISFKAIRQFTPTNLYEMVKAFFECLPLRYKEIHIINYPGVIKICWNIIRPLLSEKLRKRFIFHSSQEDIHDYIPISVLPIEYGGHLNEELDKSAMDSWFKNACDEQRKCTLEGQCNLY